MDKEDAIMTFDIFRDKIEKKLPKDFVINYPLNKKESFFWISVPSTIIGTSLCHYEFVKEGESEKVNLELHFEFIEEDIKEKKLIIHSLCKKTLLKKDISNRNKDVSPYQVGIVYKTFELSSEKIIEDSIKNLKKLDKKFRRKISVFFK